MPNPTGRPEGVPDPSESRERAHPRREAGLGHVQEDKNTPVREPDREESRSRNQSEAHRELNADDVTDQSQAVEPTDSHAHGGRRERTEDEATNRRRRE